MDENDIDRQIAELELRKVELKRQALIEKIQTQADTVERLIELLQELPPGTRLAGESDGYLSPYSATNINCAYSPSLGVLMFGRGDLWKAPRWENDVPDDLKWLGHLSGDGGAS